MLTKSKKIVWVNGCFDVLHAGHVKLLEFASQYGEVIVGIDGDARVRELKGKSRPINPVLHRQYILESLKYVSNVVIFNSDIELSKYIKHFSPDYMVIGEEYKQKNIIGQEYIKEKIFFYPKHQDLSTTNIIKSYGI